MTRSRGTIAGLSAIVALLAVVAWARLDANRPRVLAGDRLGDASMCRDPDRSGETIDDFAGSPSFAPAAEAVAAMLTSGTRPMIERASLPELDAVVRVMDRVEPGTHTLVLPGSFRSDRIANIRLAFQKRGDEIGEGRYLIVGASFCFV